MEEVGTSILCDWHCHLGEGCTYDPARDTAWWFDILDRTLFEADLASGAVTSHAGVKDTAEEHFHGAMARARELGMRHLVAHCNLGLGRLHKETGRLETAREHLTTATSMFRAMGMKFWLERAEAALP